MKKLWDRCPNRVLERQCEQYGFELENMLVPWDKELDYVIDVHTQFKRPEDVILRKLQDKGFQGTSWELHPIQMLLQAGCAEYLERGAENILFEDYRARTFCVQIDMYGLSRKTAMEAIRSKSRDQLLRGWEEIYSCDRLQEWFPNMDVNGVAAVLDGLGLDRLYQIGEMIFDNPEDNANGWPDVFAYDGKELALVEVKTTDTLRDTQIYTWRNLIPKLGLKAKVICIEKI